MTSLRRKPRSWRYAPFTSTCRRWASSRTIALRESWKAAANSDAQPSSGRAAPGFPARASSAPLMRRSGDGPGLHAHPRVREPVGVGPPGGIGRDDALRDAELLDAL